MRQDNIYAAAGLLFAYYENLVNLPVRIMNPKSLLTANPGSFTWASQFYGSGGCMMMTEPSDINSKESLGVTLGLILIHFFREEQNKPSKEDRLFRQELSELMKISQGLGVSLNDLFNSRLLAEPSIYRNIILYSGCLDKILQNEGIFNANALVDQCIKHRQSLIKCVEKIPVIEELTKEVKKEEEIYAQSVEGAIESTNE